MRIYINDKEPVITASPKTNHYDMPKEVNKSSKHEINHK